jgi:hypothetical protein
VSVFSGIRTRLEDFLATLDGDARDDLAGVLRDFRAAEASASLHIKSLIESTEANLSTAIATNEPATKFAVVNLLEAMKTDVLAVLEAASVTIKDTRGSKTTPEPEPVTKPSPPSLRTGSGK